MSAPADSPSRTGIGSGTVSTGSLLDEAPGQAAAIGFADLLGGFRQDLDGTLEAWLADKIAEASAEAADTTELTEQLLEFIRRGGKRLRPALVYYSYRACGGGTESQVLPAAMSVELLHAYLLIHDDIMDRAETRRGAPAAHLVFERAHAERGWAGDAGRHGEAVATLLGDLAHSYAVESFMATEPEPERWREATATFNAMCREVVLGQYLEMTAPFRSALSEPDLLQILRMKSGRYSVERPIQLGAQLAGASDTALEAFSLFGLAAGEAFQLHDDLLGMFGDRDAVGKPVGSDLVEGKHTVLIHRALAAADDDQRRQIRTALGNPAATQDQVATACSAIEATGARAAVETMVRERMETSRSVLAGLDLASPGPAFFTGLIDYLQERTS